MAAIDTITTDKTTTVPILRTGRSDGRTWRAVRINVGIFAKGDVVVSVPGYDGTSVLAASDSDADIALAGEAAVAKSRGFGTAGAPRAKHVKTGKTTIGYIYDAYAIFGTDGEPREYVVNLRNIARSAVTCRTKDDIEATAELADARSNIEAHTSLPYGVAARGVRTDIAAPTAAKSVSPSGDVLARSPKHIREGYTSGYVWSAYQLLNDASNPGILVYMPNLSHAAVVVQSESEIEDAAARCVQQYRAKSYTPSTTASPPPSSPLIDFGSLLTWERKGSFAGGGFYHVYKYGNRRVVHIPYRGDTAANVLREVHVKSAATAQAKTEKVAQELLAASVRSQDWRTDNLFTFDREGTVPERGLYYHVYKGESLGELVVIPARSEYSPRLVPYGSDAATVAAQMVAPSRPEPTATSAGPIRPDMSKLRFNKLLTFEREGDTPHGYCYHTYTGEDLGTVILLPNREDVRPVIVKGGDLAAALAKLDRKASF